MLILHQIWCCCLNILTDLAFSICYHLLAYNQQFNSKTWTECSAPVFDHWIIQLTMSRLVCGHGGVPRKLTHVYTPIENELSVLFMFCWLFCSEATLAICWIMWKCLTKTNLSCWQGTLDIDLTIESRPTWWGVMVRYEGFKFFILQISYP